MEHTATPRLQRIGTIILIFTVVPVVALTVVLFLSMRSPRYDVAIVETGELFTVTEPFVLGGDGYQKYEVRRAGRRELLGEAESGEGSRPDIGGNDASLCVHPAVASPSQDGCLFFFNPKTRQASVARLE